MNKFLLYTHHMEEGEIQFWAGEVARVDLIDWPVQAARTIAIATKGYTGGYENEISEDEIVKFCREIQKTKFGNPIEMANFVFLIRDVPRSWTHQAVRTRIGASVVQESTRFFDNKKTFKILVPKSSHNNGTVSVPYLQGTIAAITAFRQAVAEGMESQDARQLMPHNLLTAMYWSLNLQTLRGIYNVRWCCQAEPSTWIPVMKQMKEQICERCGELVADFLSAPIDRGENCGFNSAIDRPCTWRPR